MCGNISLVFIPKWRLELRRMKIVQVQIFAYTIFVICHAIAGFCFDCFYVLSFVSMCGNVALAFAI